MGELFALIFMSLISVCFIIFFSSLIVTDAIYAPRVVKSKSIKMRLLVANDDYGDSRLHVAMKDVCEEHRHNKRMDKLKNVRSHIQIIDRIKARTRCVIDILSSIRLILNKTVRGRGNVLWNVVF
jgi:hypothetical protein